MRIWKQKEIVFKILMIWKWSLAKKQKQKQKQQTNK